MLDSGLQPPTLRAVTLGCKVNQYETEFVRQGLAGVGYRDALGDEAADLCIVNTCTVTAEGDAKSRQTIRQLARQNPQARIIVMGCYATRAPAEVAALPGVVEVVTDKRELPDLLSRHGVRDVPTGLSDFRGKHRAFVKVQDGCILNCSFCIIPIVRPGLTSRPVAHLLDEARRLANRGFREIVLTGIHLGHYGVDWNRGRPKSEWTRLAQLVDRLALLGEELDFRIRLSSIEATEVTAELIEALAAHPRRVCPHLHISMQSGSDAVLRRMRRRWGSQRFVDCCRRVKSALPEPALTTDIIIGFPGESEAEFLETCQVVEEVGFSKLHLFRFSPRAGTDAATMPRQVPKEHKDERRERLLAIEQNLQEQYRERLRGRRLQWLVEGEFPDRPGMLLGTACRYVQMEFAGKRELVGNFVEMPCA